MNKHHTEQFVSKIKAPIVCRFDGKELSFEDGEALAAHQFEKRYGIKSIEVEDGKAVVYLQEKPVPNINFVGEEIVSGDDWIQEHIEKFGKEPNLFDGV